MKKNIELCCRAVNTILVVFAGILIAHVHADVSKTYAKTTTASSTCPNVGWSEGLAAYLKKQAKMPTAFSATADDCDFNQWSWEAFIWATAKVNGAPRFMSMDTPSDLLKNSSKKKNGILRLSSRSAAAHHSGGKVEGAGAIVEADGSMLVGPNGYPVYASIHMNKSYCKTAKNNLIINGDYSKNASKDDYFNVGAGVVKATWFRYDDAFPAPAGAYVTEAEVPVLTRISNNYSSSSVVVKTDANGKGIFEKVMVALVGVHVVGYVEHHPEFLWATFEHKLNAPMIKDNTFSPTGSNASTFTFYQANTPYTDVLIANQPETSSDPALLAFDDATGKFSPITQVVQMNKTGGDNRPNGPANILAINQSAQSYLSASHFEEPKHFKEFMHYNLIGTTWMEPDVYLTSTQNWQQFGQADAQGAVNLANSTAETFMQISNNNVPKSTLGNCFECHNPQSFTYGDKGVPALPARRIGISHIISEGTSYAVPNIMPVKMLPLEVEEY